MDINLIRLGKRFESGWVLRNITMNIPAGSHISITGPNGSGKSTLLQLICGYLTPSAGQVKYLLSDSEIHRDQIFKYCSISAAYMELEEELTPKELFQHYKIFKPLLVSDYTTFISQVELLKEGDKQIRFFSSGMKQRLSLGLAMMMDVPLLFLDEPSSFLDAEKKAWFLQMLDKYGSGKTVLIASNDDEDLKTCKLNIDLQYN